MRDDKDAELRRRQEELKKKYEVEEMKEILQLITEEFDAMQITLKSTEDFKVDQHFDRLTNRWSMVGVSEAFDKTVKLCNRISEDIII